MHFQTFIMQQYRIDKPTFALLIGLTTAIGSLLTGLLPYYVHSSALVPITAFITTIVNLIVIWLRDESSAAPEPGQGSPPTTTTGSQPSLQWVLVPQQYYQTRIPLANQPTVWLTFHTEDYSKDEEQ